MMHKACSRRQKVPCWFARSSVKFHGHMGQKIPILAQIERFRTVTPGWDHKRLQTDAQSLAWRRRGILLSFEMIRHTSNWQGRKPMICLWFECFRMTTGIWIHAWLWSDRHSFYVYGRCSLLILMLTCHISSWHGLNKRFESHLRLQGRSSL